MNGCESGTIFVREIEVVEECGYGDGCSDYHGQNDAFHPCIHQV